MSRIPSPQSGRRGCLCKDGTYSIECCDGSFQAQGIGNITRYEYLLYTEAGNTLIQENGFKLFQ